MATRALTARFSVRQAISAVRRGPAPVPSRGLQTGRSLRREDVYKNREKAEEAAYVRQREAELKKAKEANKAKESANESTTKSTK